MSVVSCLSCGLSDQAESGIRFLGGSCRVAETWPCGQLPSCPALGHASMFFCSRAGKRGARHDLDGRRIPEHQGIGDGCAACFPALLAPNRDREIGGGRATRQPGQVRKEAALTSSGSGRSSVSYLFFERIAPTDSPSCAGSSAIPQAGFERHSFADRSMTDAGTPPISHDAIPGASDSSRQGGFDLGGPPQAGKPYRVLARKDRPSSFDDLIGQDAVVRTVSNAFETGRIPQAWILTGVRGVGKTTTARILARALNYELPDGSVKGPTIHMPVPGLHCQAIMESRHMDVLEMDAASHTGVDDVRQINDSVRYAPASARYKVYIIDEVHMLSTAAFNAFLKTLEEPQEHAKFVFATTEIRKVPVTVLSRCQRFDLRRVEADVLMGHLANIAAREGVEVEPEALGIVARAAEGSVRDSLSLFDQAIAHAAGTVRADAVRQMLGLADRTRVIDLFDSLPRGDIASAFREFREQYDVGADPVVVLSDLAEFVNFVTRVKVVPATADNVAYGETERVRARDFAAKLSMRVLSRMWQMLLKGITEVQSATRPAAAAEMVLVRIAYVADMPTPDEAIRMLEQNGGGSPVISGRAAPSREAPASTMSSMPSSPMRAPTAPRTGAEASARPQMVTSS